MFIHISLKMKVHSGPPLPHQNLVYSMWYLSHFAPYFAKDLLWPEYNTSGYQNFLIDCVNVFLELSINITLSQAVMQSGYNTPNGAAKVHPAYPMSIMLNTLSSIECAIINLRNTTTFFIYLPTQYYWVNFDQTWELAHSIRRQLRCRKKYSLNDAVYLETILRNVNWNDFFTPANKIDGLLFLGITQSGAGQLWLQNTAIVSTTIAEEYTIAWWPGNFAYDLFLGKYCNGSILPTASNYYINKYCDGINATSIEAVSGFTDSSGYVTQQRAAIQKALGPILSTNLWVVPVPKPLSKLIATLLSSFHDTIMSMKWSPFIPYPVLQSIVLTPHSPHWNEDYLYYGGNPLCLYGTAQTSFKHLLHSMMIAQINFL
ncbi:hypothetical protein THRCLA_07977 [Thraustotheca clavata]|uniref:Uncharacterized protein n=1 Tax=Thraustotheca clavata TaxID=74557 RepID=A0A1V9ZBN5_9STRA|nr:hypothetical protein THRCLA_07977 [Thraustotheca clavata]